jgi:hypothetical protein
MVNYERKMIPTQQGGSIDLEGTLDSAIVELQKLQITYGPKAKLELFTEMYSDSDREHLYIVVDVPETDDVMQNRINDEEKYEAMRETRELAEFKRLAAKFKDK